ncbi:hypothetical protein FB645_000622 [Coemansia sp. IMI 203386]|nr:hypothetical protein FB645_000622 [Coemansia sp. IMI 203386]
MSTMVLSNNLKADHQRTKQAITEHHQAEEELDRVAQECYDAYEQARRTYEQDIQAAKNKLAQAENKIAQDIWEAMVSKESATENATNQLMLIKQSIVNNYPFLDDLGIKIDMPQLQL